MAVQTATRFTPSLLISPTGPSGGSRRTARRPSRRHGAETPRLGRGLLLLLAGAAATTGWADAPADASTEIPPDGAEALAAQPQAGAADTPNPERPLDPPVPTVPSPLWDAAALEKGFGDDRDSPGAARPTPAAAGMTERIAQGTITVRSGETLWSLTSDLLGPDAAQAEVARQWPLLWEANADQIRDPDHVLAGTVLHLPLELLPEQ